MGNYIRFDWMIKRLLRDKRNFVVVDGFLSVLIGRQIKITQVLESEGNQETEDQKFNRVDLLVEDDKTPSARQEKFRRVRWLSECVDRSSDKDNASP